MEEIKSILSSELSNKLNNFNDVTEVRLRCNKKCIIYFKNQEQILDYIPSFNDLLNILIKVSNSSLYAIQNDINQGFVTIKGGHRLGVVGEVVINNGKIINIKNISGINIRVAREVKGVSDKVINHVIKDGNIKNTLIVSPPGCGKTTLLRDILRILANEKNINVGIVDERGEIASIYKGVNCLDIGLRCDILSNVSKDIGIEMLVRSMGINVIATDEIGSKKDIEAIKYAFLSGVKLIFTMHGSSLNDVYKKTDIKEIIDFFDTVIILSKKNGVGTIDNIHILDKSNLEVI